MCRHEDANFIVIEVFGVSGHADYGNRLLAWVENVRLGHGQRGHIAVGKQGCPHNGGFPTSIGALYAFDSAVDTEPSRV